MAKEAVEVVEKSFNWGKASKILKYLLLFIIAYIIITSVNAENSSGEGRLLPNPFKPKPTPNPTNTGGGSANYSGGGSSYIQASFPIRKGMKGAEVTFIQNYLREKGQNISADGKFGPKTEAALTAVTGVSSVSNALYQQMQNGGGTSNTNTGGGTSSDFPLKINDFIMNGASNNVKTLQNALNRKHNSGLTVDGKFGAKTKKALNDNGYGATTSGGTSVSQSAFNTIIA